MKGGLTTGSSARKLLASAVPMLVGALFQQLWVGVFAQPHAGLHGHLPGLSPWLGGGSDRIAPGAANAGSALNGNLGFATGPFEDRLFVCDAKVPALRNHMLFQPRLKCKNSSMENLYLGEQCEKYKSTTRRTRWESKHWQYGSNNGIRRLQQQNRADRASKVGAPRMA